MTSDYFVCIERLIPLVVQDKGFFTSQGCSEDSARTEIYNFYYSEKTLKQDLFKKFVFCRLDDMSSFISTIYNENVEHEIKPKYSKRNLKKKIMKYIILNVITLFVVAKFKRMLAYLKKQKLSQTGFSGVVIVMQKISIEIISFYLT